MSCRGLVRVVLVVAAVEGNSATPTSGWGRLIANQNQRFEIAFYSCFLDPLIFFLWHEFFQSPRTAPSKVWLIAPCKNPFKGSFFKDVFFLFWRVFVYGHPRSFIRSHV